MGDVLEFVPPSARAPLLLRIYEFEDIRHHRTTTVEGINAGQQPVLRIPFVWFHEESVDHLRQDFPVNSIVRKERALTKDAWARLKLDAVAQDAERGKAREDEYQTKRAQLVNAVTEQNEGVTFRTPRLGVEGCCGRGCNGCQHFWHDPRYAKARDLLKSKKQGTLLSGQEAKISDPLFTNN
jgi:putative protease